MSSCLPSSRWQSSCRCLVFAFFKPWIYHILIITLHHITTRVIIKMCIQTNSSCFSFGVLMRLEHCLKLLVVVISLFTLVIFFFFFFALSIMTAHRSNNTGLWSEKRHVWPLLWWILWCLHARFWIDHQYAWWWLDRGRKGQVTRGYVQGVSQHAVSKILQRRNSQMV